MVDCKFDLGLCFLVIDRSVFLRETHASVAKDGDLVFVAVFPVLHKGTSFL